MSANQVLTSRRLIAMCCWAIVTLLSCALDANAQQATTPGRGFQPGGSYSLSNIESISTTNGNLMLSFPFKLPSGRGGSTAQIGLHYDSKTLDGYFEQYFNPNNGTWTPRQMLGASTWGGWHYGLGYDLIVFDRLSTYGPDQPIQCQADRNRWQVKMALPDGSVHELLPFGWNSFASTTGYYYIRPNGDLAVCGCFGDPNVCSSSIVPTYNTTIPYYSFDGSNLRLDVHHDWTWTLYMSDGTRVTGNWGTSATRRIYDRNGNDTNGNYVTLDNITYNGNPATKLYDPLGRYVIVEHVIGQPQDTVHMLGTAGSPLTYQIKWKQINVNKTYQPEELSEIAPGPPLGDPAILGSLYAVSEIDLPAETGGLKYTFAYNAPYDPGTPTSSSGWGELNSIVLPSQAQAQYQYLLDGENSLETEVVLRNTVTQKTLTYQAEYDSASTTVTEVTQYSIDDADGGTATITDPDGGQMIEHHDSFKRAYKVEHPDGTVVERIWKPNLVYQFPQLTVLDQYSVNNYDPQRVNSFVKTEFTSVKAANGNLSKTAIKDYTYDKNDNVTSVNEYDWVNYGDVDRDSNNNPTGTIPGTAVRKRVMTHTLALPTPDASNTTTNSANAYWNLGSPSLRVAVASTEVSDGAQTLTRTEFVYDHPESTGNLTQQKSWDSWKGGVARAYSNPLTATNSISVTNQYDSYGNLTIATDALGVQTKLTYGSVGGFSDLYPTQIVNAFGAAVARTTNKTYDFNTGLVTSVVDFDNSVTTKTTYDVFGRPTLLEEADQSTIERQTATEYSDVSRRVIVRSDLSSTGDAKLVSIQHYDQLGRIRLSRQLEDASMESATDETKGIKVQTRYRYSGTNSYRVTSNPYRATTSGEANTEETMGWTRTKMDQGGRVTEVETFSGEKLPSPWGTGSNENTASSGKVTTLYDAEKVTVTDQGGKQRRSVTDGLGRLAQVAEAPSSSNYLTTYAYDALDDLTTVTQNQANPVVNQGRTFVYTSLKRLNSATNPENGTITYTYDDNGNLKTKTDALSKVITYNYDGLNRATSRTYSDSTPAATFYYDSQVLPYTPTGFTPGKSAGKLVAVTYVVGSSNGTYTGGYDELGRPASSVQRTDSTDYSFGYAYNRNGEMTSETYPSGKVVQTEYDSAGRIAGVKKDATAYYAGAAATDATNRIQYAAQGAVSVVKLGNGKWEHTSFNARLQPREIGLGASGTASDLLKMEYTYGQTNNNGNLLTQTITAPKTAGGNLVLTQNYTYDALNRLSFAEELISATSQWNQTYDIDRWGNRAVRSVSAAINPSTYIPNPLFTPQSANSTDFSAFDQTTNRLNLSVMPLFSYDLSGNVTSDPNTPGNGIAYDAENRQTGYTKSGVGTTSYSYDGDGRRVKRTNPDNSAMIFVHNAGGQLIAEYTSGTPSGSGTSYLTSDHLGSTRVVTSAADGSGNVTVKARYDYLPFGEEIGSDRGSRSLVTGYVTSDKTRQKFTQKERDNESGLDYFGARYYSSAQGRFTSVDAGRINRRHLANPQKWNRYAYTLNNPLKYIDPDGLEELVVYVRTFIPQKETTFPQILRGDGRNAGERGTYRTEQRIVIETDPAKNGGNPLVRERHESGTSERLGDIKTTFGREVLERGSASGETLKTDVSRDQNGVVNIHASGNESTPVVPLAPGITYNFDIKLQSEGPQGNATVTVTGEHDRFPGYEIIVQRPEAQNNGQQLVYQFDPRTNGNTPISLIPIFPNEKVKEKPRNIPANPQ